mmetsp:Transcript_85426/g.276644  ORF Transcript_85426/g.276644 Transcript_85426/m.276644 type:complete len:376 (-) Transcript_85426:58-1185(-)
MALLLLAQAPAPLLDERLHLGGGPLVLLLCLLGRWWRGRLRSRGGRARRRRRGLQFLQLLLQRLLLRGVPLLHRAQLPQQLGRAGLVQRGRRAGPEEGCHRQMVARARAVWQAGGCGRRVRLQRGPGAAECQGPRGVEDVVQAPCNARPAELAMVVGGTSGARGHMREGHAVLAGDGCRSLPQGRPLLELRGGRARRLHGASGFARALGNLRRLVALSAGDAQGHSALSRELRLCGFRRAGHEGAHAGAREALSVQVPGDDHLAHAQLPGESCAGLQLFHSLLLGLCVEVQGDHDRAAEGLQRRTPPAPQAGGHAGVGVLGVTAVKDLQAVRAVEHRRADGHLVVEHAEVPLGHLPQGPLHRQLGGVALKRQPAR